MEGVVCTSSFPLNMVQKVLLPPLKNRCLSFIYIFFDKKNILISNDINYTQSLQQRDAKKEKKKTKK
jgi:hypothetical protein